MGGTSSSVDLACLTIVLTSLYLTDRASSIYTIHLSLCRLPSYITFYEYCLKILTSTLCLIPFHIRGVNFLGGSSFMFEIAQSFHLLLLDLWSWRSCLAHGILQCAERMWSFVSQWNMSGFFLFSFFSAAFTCFSSCVVFTKLNLYLTELLTLFIIFCDLAFLPRRCVEGTSKPKN